MIAAMLLIVHASSLVNQCTNCVFVVCSYVEHMIAAERDAMRCCRVEYARPVQSTQTLLYGGILVAGFLVYFLVIYFSSSERSY